MDCDALETHLDEIDLGVQVSSPFDVSPRGIRFRPDAQLEAMIGELSECGEQAVAALSKRLGTVDDQFLALAWLHALKTIDTEEAEDAIDLFVERMLKDHLWEKTFPGPREILLFLGR